MIKCFNLLFFFFFLFKLPQLVSAAARLQLVISGLSVTTCREAVSCWLNHRGCVDILISRQEDHKASSDFLKVLRSSALNF